MTGYVTTMREHWRATDRALFVEPVLYQWGYFFNPRGSLTGKPDNALDVQSRGEAPRQRPVHYVATGRGEPAGCHGGIETSIVTQVAGGASRFHVKEWLRAGTPAIG